MESIPSDHHLVYDLLLEKATIYTIYEVNLQRP